MAAQTISAIIERFETVLAAAPLNLEVSQDPFSDTGVANTFVDTTVRVTHGGLVNDRITSNYQSMRIDRISVTVLRAFRFSGIDAQREVQDLLDEIERAIVADGPDNGYMVNVEKGSRKPVKKKGTDVLEAAIHFLVDYDFSEA